MSCSISTAGKSTSSWLDRLRSSKGFPSTTNLDLDRFLTSQTHDSNSSTAETIHSKQLQQDPPLNRHQASDAQVPDGETQMFGIISNALADLFVMGDSVHVSNLPDKKCSRKQSNPRFCVNALNSSDSDNTLNLNGEIDTRKNDTASPVSDDNSGVGIVKEMTNDHEQVKLVENLRCAEEEGEDDKGFLDLAGFSTTEVTVIDTSFAGWKFEKMLFRKNNTWKARDKKSNGLKLGNKKRKAFAIGKEKEALDTVKKLKVLNQESGTPKNGSSGACDEENPSTSKSDAACSKTSGAFDKDPKEKQPILNVEGSSSIVLMKSGPRSKKRRTSFPRRSANLSHKQTNE